MENQISNKKVKALNNDFFIRKALISDVKHFVNLIDLSAHDFFPAVFGKDVLEILSKLFEKKRNVFSHENVYIIENNERVIGMALGYDWTYKNKHNLKTGIMLLAYLKYGFLKEIRNLLKIASTTGWMRRNEYYISNIAVYPENIGFGFGSKLMEFIEGKAKELGLVRIGLDVEIENQLAINLYKRLGYDIEKKSVVMIGGRVFGFYRMYKDIKNW